MNTLKSIEKTLRKQGYKITKQRKSILEVFLRERDNLLNAQQIYNRVKEIYPTIDFSTVYRNIELLVDRDIIHRINTGKPYGSYKLKEQKEHHHHIICKDCGRTEIIEFCPFKQMEEQLMGKDFVPTEHSFEVFGYCAKCKHKRE